MNNHYLVSMGRRISDIRRINKITQEKLADMLGVSPKHISHTECGTSGLSLKNLIEFCKIFNCSLDYLVFGKTGNSILDKLPEEIINLLSHGTEEELDRFNRYLQIYIELSQKQN